MPVINKIDLPAADAPRVKKEIEDIIGIPAEDSPEISAKMHIHLHEVLERIVSDVPAPVGDPAAPLRALIFDSQYDPYKGVIVYMRLLDGTIRPGMKVKMMATGAEFQVLECGYMLPLGLSRLLHRLHQKGLGHPCRRYRHRVRPPHARGAPRLPSGAPHGFLRHLYRGRLQVSRSARCA